MSAKFFLTFGKIFSLLIDKLPCFSAMQLTLLCLLNYTNYSNTKQVNFTVAAAPNQTLTPAADKSDANQKNAVKTGDNTPILPFVIILVIAVVLIAGILVYRNKKK